jgi:hypothetical protein
MSSNVYEFVKSGGWSGSRVPAGAASTTVAQTLALNQLCDQMWLYYNFFQPVMRLEERSSSPAVTAYPGE